MTPPYVVSRASRAAEAAEQWKNQYHADGSGWNTIKIGRPSQDIWADLKALGSSPDPDDVDRVIGNTCWTEARCDQCGKTHDRVVVVGQSEDYDSSTAQLCRECLVEALELLREGPA